MKQLLILSGKGGTGKTTIASSFIRLQDAKVYGDCDVDAPNLHLSVARPSKPTMTAFYGLPKAIIDQDKCIACGLCASHCRFDAIDHIAGKYQINPYGCEGCGVCELLCPQKAIALEDAIAGDLILYHDDHVFSTACLHMGSGTSGKLVAEVKNQLKGYEEPLVIVDGSPGIGCPVIASLSGADMVLVVTEPTLSGISDMKRILDTASRFKMKLAVCINKWDINTQNTLEIEAYCEHQEIPLVGKVPYDSQVIRCLNQGSSIIETDSKASLAIQEAFDKTKEMISQ